MSTIIDGEVISSKIQNEMKAQLKNCMIRPSIAVMEVGEDSNSVILFSL